jgi:high-affinity iron transporter
VTAARRALVALLFAAIAIVLGASPANAAAGSVSRSEAIDQLHTVRESIDHTLDLIKAGNADEAFAEAKAGYLRHFEVVEVPLRVVAPGLTADAETKFAEIRALISDGASTGKIRSQIIELRRLIDDAERRLTDTGAGAPMVVAGQSFMIIFREGLEAVLLLSALLGYLESAKASQYRKPILLGMGLAVVATAVTFFAIGAVLDALPFGREVLEAITAIVAVLVLFWVSFWLIARLEHKRWMEFLRTRVWSAVSVGSTAALVLIGFTAIYREGFETALFYQALMTFGSGLGVYVALGLGLGLVALAAVSYAIFKLGRRLPVRTFLTTAVVILMATSVTFLGNAVRSLQEADVVRLSTLDGWPRAPIFLAQALGYWPSKETIGAQSVLAAIYVLGAVYLFVLRPRFGRAATGRVPVTG